MAIGNGARGACLSGREATRTLGEDAMSDFESRLPPGVEGDTSCETCRRPPRPSREALERRGRPVLTD